MPPKKKGCCIIAITILDAPCGAGKTEYIIRYMNEHLDRPFLYISPLRKMFDRLNGEGDYEGRGVNRQFFTPETDRYNRTKLSSIKEMIAVGLDIMSTHSLFLRLDNDAIDMLRRRDYELIIDEALDVVSVISKEGKKMDDDFCFQELKQELTVGDLETLLEWGCIDIDASNYNRAVWVKNPSDKHRYEDVERMVRTGTVYYINDSFLVWSFPIAALEAFDNVTILTYRFGSSVFKAYLDFYGKEYEHKTVVRDGDELRLADFSPEIESGKQYAPLINICIASKLNAIGVRLTNKSSYPLSMTWYTKIGKEQKKAVQNNMINYLRHYCNADGDSVMWTTFKTYADAIKPKGYILRNDGKEKTMIPCNSRATEEYSDRYNLVYLIDRHLHPGIKAFFHQKDITIPEGEYALSDFIQWIFRSRIRKLEPVNLYVPSERMRNLLFEWLDL